MSLVRSSSSSGRYAGAQPRLLLGRQRPDVVVDHLDLEALQALGDVAADAAHADDADPLLLEHQADRAELAWIQRPSLSALCASVRCL